MKVAVHEEMSSRPLLVFPSKTRKYIRLTPKHALESLTYLLKEASNDGNIETEQENGLAVKANLGGALGPEVKVKILPEGEVSALDFTFKYTRFLTAAITTAIILILVSIFYRSVLPVLGIFLIATLAYKVNASAVGFLSSVNKTLPYIEREFQRQILMKDRERWRKQPKNIDNLYARLRRKHIATWGNTNVLEYKIAEYQTQGLTRDEAIRKTAEEEGIY